MFEKIIEFEPAYDKRDPDPSKNYGVHGVNLRFVLKGEKGAIQFLIYTNWQLPNVAEETRKQITPRNADILLEPFPADVGYHSYTPMYDGQETISDSCSYLDGKPCYYDGSGLAAENVFEILLREGHEGVWNHLASVYEQRFGVKE